MKTKAVASDRPYHHGNLRESLLQAAQDMLASGGEQRLSLREVAKACGVSHAAPYHHFGSLEGLLAAIAERAFDQLTAAMAAGARDREGSGERLLRICTGYVSFACAQPAQFRLMFGPRLASMKAANPGLKVAGDRAFEVLAQASHAHAPTQATEMALSAWSLVHGLANLLIDGALQGLPVEVPDTSVLAKLLTQRLL